MGRRVGFYISSFSGGGAEREMIYLANEFAGRGYTVDLFVHRNEGPLKCLVDRSVEQIVIDRNYIHDVFALVRYMRQMRPWFITSTLHVPNWSLAIAKFFARGRTRVFWRIVIILSHSKRSSSSLIYRSLSVLYPLLSRIVDGIICVSAGVADDAIANFGIPKHKCHVMHNPAYHESIHVLAKEPVHHEWFDGSNYVVVAMGRLSRQKDFATLITALPKVLESVKGVRLVILGGGPLENSLRNLIGDLQLSDTVQLLGFEINPYKYLAKADLFVLSSRFEGFGNVVVEALALNVPVISTDCPSGPAEILEGGKWGRLVPVGDSAKMAEAIVEAFRQEVDTDTLSRARDFDVGIAIDKYEGLMKRAPLKTRPNVAGNGGVG